MYPNHPFRRAGRLIIVPDGKTAVPGVDTIKVLLHGSTNINHRPGLFCSGYISPSSLQVLNRSDSQLRILTQFRKLLRQVGMLVVSMLRRFANIRKADL